MKIFDMFRMSFVVVSFSIYLKFLSNFIWKLLAFARISYSLALHLFVSFGWCTCSAYRAFYLLNWIYRFFTEIHKIRWIRKFFLFVPQILFPLFLRVISLLMRLTLHLQNTAWISGLVQTALYADFFYYYIQRYHASFLSCSMWKTVHFEFNV